MAKDKQYSLPPSYRMVMAAKPTMKEKSKVAEFFVPLLSQFKEDLITGRSDAAGKMLTDIYGKWQRDFFYLEQLYTIPGIQAGGKGQEVKFLRLKPLGNELYEMAYLRYTGEWLVVTTQLTLDDCRKTILENPVLQPIG